MAKFDRASANDQKKSGGERALAAAVMSRRDMREKEEAELNAEEESEAALDRGRGRGKSGFFSGMFASNVSFSVNGAPIRGKDGHAPAEADVVPLFAGAALDLTPAALIGRRRDKMVWAEGHHAKLALSPQGTDAAKLIPIEDIWIGLRDENQPGKPSVIMSTNRPVTIHGNGYTLTAQMLFMTEDHLDEIKLIAAELKNKNGKVLKQTAEARVTENGVSGGGSGDLFAAAQEEEERARREEEERARREEEERTRREKEETERRQKAEEEARRRAEAAEEAPQSGDAGNASETPAAERETGQQSRTPTAKELAAEALRKAHEDAEARYQKASEDAEEEDADDDDDDEDEDEDEDEESGSDSEDQGLLDSIREDVRTKIEEIQAIIDSWKLGEAYEAPEGKEDDEDDGYNLPIAEVPILLPFVYASINLKADSKLEHHFIKEINLDDKLQELKDQAEKVKTDALAEFKDRKTIRTEEEALAARTNYQNQALALIDHVDAGVRFGICLSGNAWIGLELAANAGFPGLLELSAGVMGSVGVKGAGSDETLLQGELSAQVSISNGSSKRPDVSVSNLRAEAAGSLNIYAALSAGLNVQSPVFDWKKEILKGEKEKNLGKAAFGAAFQHPQEIRSVRDLFSGWYLASSTLRSTGLMDTFLEDHPAKNGFDIFNQDAYEIPVKEADEMLASADNFLAVYGDLLGGGAQRDADSADKYSVMQNNAEQLLSDLAETRKMIAEIMKVTENEDTAKQSLAKLKGQIEKHEKRLQALQAVAPEEENPRAMILDGHGNARKETENKQVPESVFYSESREYQTFEKEHAEEETKKQLATRDNLIAYETEREAAFLNGDEKYQRLLRRYEGLSEEEKDRRNPEFAAAYEKDFKRSERVKKKAYRSNLGDLKDFERRAWYKSVEEKRQLLKQMLKKCTDLGFTPPEILFTGEAFEMKLLDAKEGERDVRAADEDGQFFAFMKDADKEALDHLWEYVPRSTMLVYETVRMQETIAKSARAKKADGGKAETTASEKDALPKEGGIISLYTELLKLEDLIRKKDDPKEPEVAAFRNRHEKKLTDYIKEKPGWLYVTKEGIEQYEMQRALEKMPDEIRIDAGERKIKKKKENFLAGILEKQGLLQLTHSIGLEKYNELVGKKLSKKEVKKRDELKDILDQIASCIGDGQAALSESDPDTRNTKLAAQRAAGRALIRRYLEFDKDAGKDVIGQIGSRETAVDSALFLAEAERIAGQRADKKDGADWAEFRKHMQRYHQMQKHEDGIGDYEAMVEYVSPRESGTGDGEKTDQAGKRYLRELEKQHKADWLESSKDHAKNQLKGASYNQLLTFTSMVLTNRGFRYKKSDTASHLERIRGIRNAQSDEEALAFYRDAGAGGGLNDMLKKDHRKVTPSMFFAYERDRLAEDGKRHGDRLKLIDEMEKSGAGYEQILLRYEEMVRSQSRIKNLLAAFKIKMRTKFEKQEAARKIALDAVMTPKQIVENEQKLRAKEARKHTERLERLRQQENVPESYLQQNTRGFYRSREAEIKTKAKALRASLTPRERHALYIQYEQQRLSKFNEINSAMNGGMDMLRERDAAIAAQIQKISELTKLCAR